MSLLSKIFGVKEIREQVKDEDTTLDCEVSEKNNAPRHESDEVPSGEGAVENDHKNQNLEEEKNTADPKDLAFRHFLYMEAAYKYQEITPREHAVIPRTTSDHLVTFNDVFKVSFPELISRFTGKAYVCKREGETVSADCHQQAEAFLNHSPFIFLFRRNEDGTSSVIDESVNLSLEYKGKNDHIYFTSIVVKPIGSTANSVYARVTLMVPSEQEEDLVTCQSKCLPRTASFIMIYDVMNPEDDLKRFESIEKSTIQKVNERQKLDVYEDEVLRGMSGINYAGYNIGFGKWLLDHQRFYDAYVTFQRVYNCLKHDLFHLEKEAQSMFYHACYGMGICMQQLGFLDKSAYYLQLAINGGEEFIGGYVEVLALASHNRVCYFMNQLRSQAAQSEAAAKEVKRLEQVVAEAESRHSVPETIDLGIMPLGYILQHQFDAAPECLLSAAICPMDASAQTAKIITSKEEIWNLNLAEIHDALLYIRYSRSGSETGLKDASLLCQNGCIVLNVKSAKSAEGKTYSRVNIMFPNFAQNDEKHAPGPFNWPCGASFIMGQEVKSMPFSRVQLKEIFEASLELKQSFRVVEAMRGFEYVHNALKIEYTKVSASEEVEELFFDATFQLGFCLVELGLFERATYYLDWAQEGYKVDYAREYVNCLCNNDDIRALGVIDNILATMKRPDEEQYQESYEYFIAFMKRRKAFVLINRHMYPEAEKLLTEMLENPISREFAEQELEFLKKTQEEK